MRRELIRRLERLENDRYITDDGVEAIFATVVDNTREGAGMPLPVLGWRFQRHGNAEDVVTMREAGEDDATLRERHLATVRQLLPQGSVPMFLPINPESAKA